MSIIASASNTLKFHHWLTEEPVQTYTPATYEEGHIKSISWSKDGSWIVLVPSVGPPEVISIKNDTIKPLQTIEAIYHPTWAVFQNTTKRNIAISTLLGQIFIYDIKAKSVKKRLPMVSSTITQLQYNAKDTHLASSCANGEILLYSSMSSNLCWSYRTPKAEGESTINFHHTKRNLLCAGNEDGFVAVWDINTNGLIFDVQAHQAPITGLTFSPIRSDMLITAGLDRRFAFYDTLAKKLISEFEVSSSVTALNFTACGKYLGLGSRAGVITLYDMRKLHTPISTLKAHDGSIRHLLFQKQLLSKEEANNSVFDIAIGGDDIQHQVQKQEDGVAVDSLESILCNDVSLQSESEAKCQISSADSFLMALGLDGSCPNSSDVKTQRLDSEIPEDIDGRSSTSRRSSVQLESKKTGTTPSALNVRRPSSTPKFPDTDVAAISISPLISSSTGNLATATISPLISSNKEKTIIANAGVSADEMKNMIREVVKEELETFKKDVKDEFVEVLSHTRQQFLNTQMSISKMYVDLQIQNDKVLKELVILKERIDNNNS